MARRPPDEQALHDRVIHAIFELLSNAGRIAQTNPGPLRMISISGYYPDVLAALVHERTDIVQAIYEVEPGAPSRKSTLSTSGPHSLGSG